MSNRGGFRGAPTTRGGRGDFRGRGRGGFQHAGPPDTIIEVGMFSHAVEDEMLCSSVLTDRVPKFNSPIYLQNKSMIGKLDEILGPINEVYFSVKMGEGMVAGSFKKGDKVYIGGDQLLPLERFLPKPKISGKVEKRGRSASAGGRGARGGRGGRGGRGTLRGMGRAGAPRGAGPGRSFGDFRGSRGRGGLGRGRGRGRGRGH